MRFLNDSTPPYDLTYDDVFMVPRHSAVPSRDDVDLTAERRHSPTQRVARVSTRPVPGRLEQQLLDLEREAFLKLTGGSVGLFEGKKIGRAKNLEKLHEEIVARVIGLLEREPVPVRVAQRQAHQGVLAFARRQERELRAWLSGRTYVTPDDIKEILLQTAIYCGVPSANTAFKTAQQVF